MRFKDLLLQAKVGDEKAFGELLIMYRPLLLKESILDGVFDEDLYSDIVVSSLKQKKRCRTKWNCTAKATNY